MKREITTIGKFIFQTPLKRGITPKRMATFSLGVALFLLSFWIFEIEISSYDVVKKWGIVAFSVSTSLFISKPIVDFSTFLINKTVEKSRDKLIDWGCIGEEEPETSSIFGDLFYSEGTDFVQIHDLEYGFLYTGLWSDYIEPEDETDKHEILLKDVTLYKEDGTKVGKSNSFYIARKPEKLSIEFPNYQGEDEDE